MSTLAETAKTAVAVTRGEGSDRPSTVLDLIHAQRPAIQRALPAGMSAERFTRIVLTEVRRTPALMKCRPESLLASLMLSAQLGLEPGPLGHAYFLPFKDQVTFIVGYKGMIDLARRSGEISTISARTVREGDHFHYEYGLHEKLEHIPAPGDRGAIVYVYAVARLKDGGHQFVVLTMDEVESFRGRSPSANAKSSPWKTDFEAMALKTAVRRLFPWLPVSPEAARAVEVDETTPLDLSEDIAASIEPTAPQDDESEPEDPDQEPFVLESEEGAG